MMQPVIFILGGILVFFFGHYVYYLYAECGEFWTRVIATSFYGSTTIILDIVVVFAACTFGYIHLVKEVEFNRKQFKDMTIDVLRARDYVEKEVDRAGKYYNQAVSRAKYESKQIMTEVRENETHLLNRLEQMEGKLQASREKCKRLEGAITNLKKRK